MNFIEKAFTERQDKLDTDRAQWEQVSDDLNPIVGKLEALGIEPNFESGELNVIFTGDRQKLAAAMRILRVAGFEFTGERPSAKASGWADWWHNEDVQPGGWYFRIWFNFASSVCRRVQVGTQIKTYEEPIYEIRCGEEN